MPEMLLTTMAKETPAPGGSASNRLCKIKTLSSKLQHQRDCPTITYGLRGGQNTNRILQSLVFLRLFKHKETPLSSTVSLDMSEISLQFTRTFGLTSPFGESWSSSKSELIIAAMCENSSTLPSLELMKP